MRVVSTFLSVLQLIVDFDSVNLTSAVTYNLIPNAEPEPVDMAFMMVAEPGDCAMVFKNITPTINSYQNYFFVSSN